MRIECGKCCVCAEKYKVIYRFDLNKNSIKEDLYIINDIGEFMKRINHFQRVLSSFLFFILSVSGGLTGFAAGGDAAGNLSGGAEIRPQKGIYDWVDAKRHTAELDFSVTDSAYYAKNELLSLERKGQMVFADGALTVKNNTSASIGGAEYLGDRYGFEPGFLSFDALIEDGCLEIGVRGIKENAAAADKGITFFLKKNILTISSVAANLSVDISHGADLSSFQRIEVNDYVDEIQFLIGGELMACVAYTDHGDNSMLTVKDSGGAVLAQSGAASLYCAGFWNVRIHRNQGNICIDNLKFTYTEIDQTLPESSQRIVDYTNWVATDDLNRTTAVGDAAGPAKNEKYVGIFYFLCVTGAGIHVQDNTRIYLERGIAGLKSYLKEKGGEAYWSEPYFGYYRNTDAWVYRKHAYMLQAAGVDFIFLDISNSETFNEAHLTLFDTWLQIRREGGQTPQICFLTGDDDTRLESHMKKLLRTVYAPENYDKYEELFFKWEGKPLIFGNTSNLSDEMREILTDFTVRGCWAWKNENGYWNWLQEIRYDEQSKEYYMYQGRDPDGNFEQIAVAMGHHPSTSKGRSYVKGVQPNNGKNDFAFTSETAGLGLGFASQFEMAIAMDPQVIMITGWNEWIAGCPKGPEHTYFANTAVDGYIYIDQFNPEFSRDGEPMKIRDGVGFGDNYYYQMVDYIRKFKGLGPVVQAEGKMDPDDYSSISRWDQVSPEYRDTIGDVAFRNEPSYDLAYRYINKTGRNDFDYAKVSQDERYIYFMVKTVNDIVIDDGSNWMNLYIDIDKNHATGWEGYDYVINRSRTGLCAAVERFDGTAWSAEKIGDAEYTLDGCFLFMKVDKRDLGIQEKASVNFDFKWSDNSTADGNIMQFMDLGDTAPNDRFNFRCMTADGIDFNMQEGLSDTVLVLMIAGCGAAVLAAAVFLIFKFSGTRSKG